MRIEPPYLLFIGDVPADAHAKTAQGLVKWCPEKCLGQISTSKDAANLGIPDMGIAEAASKGARTLVVGIAPVGGAIKPEWVGIFREALAAGLDVAAGLHHRLADIPELVEAAAAGGCRLIDVRVPPKNIPVGTGKRRGGRRLLTVGTDCAIGKKWTALALAEAMTEAGLDVTFRATGQTGIMISGGGIPIDAVVSDFVAGAAEMLSPDASAEHWDVIEGQGSLFHPGYAAVSLGLLHGSQPDAFVVCHEATRTQIDAFPDFPLPSVAECIALTEANGRVTNPAIRCVGVSVNTSGLAEDRRADYLNGLAEETGVPCVDAVAIGVGAIVDRLRADFP